MANIPQVSRLLISLFETDAVEVGKQAECANAK